MFKNRFLNTASYLMDTANEGKSAAELAAEKAAQVTQQRKDIKVEVGSRSQAEIDAAADNSGGENANNNEETESEETDPEDDDETDDETTSGEGEDGETEEQKTARIAKEKEDRRQARVQKRFDKLTAELHAAKDHGDKLEAQLKEKAIEGLTEEEVNRRAEVKAKELVNQNLAEEAKKQFDKNIKVLAEAAEKADKEFPAKIGALAEEIGPIPSRMINILADLEHNNGGEVLSHLANNIDEAEEIWALPPEKMAIRLDRLSNKLKKPTTNARRVSGNPPPNKPINENNNANSGSVLPANPTKNMEDFVRIRNQQSEEYRKQRMR